MLMKETNSKMSFIILIPWVYDCMIPNCLVHARLVSYS